MTDKNFQRLGRYIQTRYGIKLPMAKKIMLESRLQKRLKVLNMDSFDEYCNYIFSGKGSSTELLKMVDAVTTNKTDFFREPAHFDRMVDDLLPGLVASKGIGIRRPLRLWSAGCSTGEEPYSLAMLLEHFKESARDFRYEILATDICTEVLQKAKAAIYDEERVKPVPELLRRRFLLRSKNRSDGLVRVNSQIRSRVEFSRLNLMDRTFEFKHRFDIIFCRNVIIYFDRATQHELIGKFYDCLQPEGYLFLGHSETLLGLDLPLESVAPTVYRKREATVKARG